MTQWTARVAFVIGSVPVFTSLRPCASAREKESRAEAQGRREGLEKLQGG
jgi:hypothetical protein